MQMKKHFLAAALALGVGTGATSALPAADIQPPTAQLGYVMIGSLVLPAWLALIWKDSAGCGPYELNGKCTGTPPLIGGVFG